MGRIIGILGSLGLGLIVAGVGLILDAKSLIYSGLVIFALMAALWLWTWARPGEITVPAPLPTLPAEDESSALPLTDTQRALVALRQARDSATIAKAYKSDEGARKAYHEIEAALLSVKQQFGFGTFKLTGKTGGTIPYINMMECLIAYIDCVYPLLRLGHVEEARAKAHAFKWHWGEDF